MRITRTSLIAGGVAVALGIGASSAYALPAEISFEASGAPVPAGTTFEAVASSVKLKDFSTGNTFAVCATVTATGELVRSPGPELEVNDLSFSGCFGPIIGSFAVAKAGMPWYFGVNGPAGANGFSVSMANWSTAGITINTTLGCTAVYSVPVSPGAMFFKNVAGGSQLVGLKAGPLNRGPGGCTLVPILGITGDAQIVEVDGAAVTGATNFWAS